MALSVCEESNYVEVKIGSYNQTTSGMNIPMTPVGSSALGLTMGIYSTVTRESYFKTYLHRETLEHLSDMTDSWNYLDRITVYNPDSKGAELVFSFNGLYYFGFYDRAKRSFALKKPNY